MNDYNPEQSWQDQMAPVASLTSERRAAFIKRTYGHLLGAMLGFVLIELILFRTGMAEKIAMPILNSGGGGWLLVLGGFMVVGWFASRTAMMAKTPTAQYAALAGYVAAQALIFVPLLFIADQFASGAIATAAVVTLVGFSGLTAIAFTSGKDFSFLGGLLKWGGIVAILAIVGGVAFGFHLGLWFSVAMVAFAGAAILYDTSKVLHHYPESRHVSASLELFGSVALMFWYVLQIAISLQSD